MTRPLLEVRDIEAGYGRVQVLFGATLDVASGEILALLGTNGAGKSTLLKVIGGLLRPSAGEVWLDGQNITAQQVESRVRSGMVQLQGGHAIFPSLTVDEHLEVGATAMRDGRRRFKERREFVLDLFPRLRERHNQRVGTMSGGERQMVALGKALLPEPTLLIIDELSLGLAPIIVRELLDVVKTCAQQGTTVLIVEQSLDTAIELADRAVFLEQGSVRFSGPPRDLLARGDLARAVFLGANGSAS